MTKHARIALVATIAAGCGIDLSGTLDAQPDAGPDGGADARNDAPFTTDGGADADDGGADVVKPPDAGPAVVYVVGANALYKLDTASKQFTQLGPLPGGGCPALQDIAIDGAGNVYATKHDSSTLYKLDVNTTSCTQVGAGGADTFPIALAFAPKGTFDTAKDTLVGYRKNGDYVRVDTGDGGVILVKQGVLGQFKPSGDLAGLGDRAYLTVKAGSGCDMNDCLFEVNFVDGAFAKVGDLPTSSIEGLAQWGGRLYGFARNGEAFDIDPFSANATTLTAPDAGGGFHGAGSPSNAPIK